MAKKSKTDFSPLKWVGLLTLVLVCYGAAFSLSAHTLIARATVSAACGGAGIITALLLRRLTRGSVWRMICAAVTATGLYMAAFYLINYCAADDSTLHTEEAVVERVYSETRYHTKRVSRKVYTRGAPYKVYFADVRFATGQTAKISLDLKKFRRTAAGDTMELRVERGAFGAPVVRF